MDWFVTSFLSHLTPQQIVADLLLVPCFFVAWFVLPRFGERALKAVEEVFGFRLAQKKRLAVLLIAVVPILLRLLLLPFLPIPDPSRPRRVQPACRRYLRPWSSYKSNASLLGLHHYRHGPRESTSNLHVEVSAGTGAALAVGQLLLKPVVRCTSQHRSDVRSDPLDATGVGSPRAGRCLGGVFAMLRLGIFSYWTNSYWGGSIAAIGGALVVGALPRIMRCCHLQDAVLSWGLGAAVLANEQQAHLEGLVLLAPVLVVLLVRFWRQGDLYRRAMLVPPCLALFCGSAPMRDIHGLLQLARNR